MSDLPGREARLRPEFAHLYPAITPDLWESAAVLADRVVSLLLRSPGSRFIATDRDPSTGTLRFSRGCAAAGLVARRAIAPRRSATPELTRRLDRSPSPAR